MREEEDREYVEQLEILIDNLNMNKEVKIKRNIHFNEFKTQLHQAIMGLHTTKNEDFGIGLLSIRDPSFDLI